jgi:hypothetical protein
MQAGWTVFTALTLKLTLARDVPGIFGCKTKLLKIVTLHDIF